MESNKTYKNIRTGTTFDVGVSRTKIKETGKPPVYVPTSTLGKHKNR